MGLLNGCSVGAGIFALIGMYTVAVLIMQAIEKMTGQKLWDN